VLCGDGEPLLDMRVIGDIRLLEIIHERVWLLVQLLGSTSAKVLVA
jgi:hypothetical protein